MNLSEYGISNQELFAFIMKKFDEYLTDQKIIFYLCKIRAKHAKQRSKKHLIHLLTENKKFNYHLNSLNQKDRIYPEIELLNSLMPSRRKWKKLNYQNRFDNNSQRINSVDYNVKSLMITIDFYKKNNPREEFLLNLNNFIEKVRECINNPNYKIKSPEIIPALKAEKKELENVCRPIAQFDLIDSLIISFTNKYLTDIFDEYFYDKSFAFRATKNVGIEKIVLTHHDSVQSILDYKNRINEPELYVAECDISKFYDSVHHTIVKKLFKRLIKKVKTKNPELYDERCERIFYKYLNSYNFVQNVLKYNNESNKNYWLEKDISNGSFGWVEEDLIKLNYFKNIKNAKIGVPQGGAISGLIANIVLDYADRIVQKNSDSKTHYTRFCDDMILINPLKSECEKISELYRTALMKIHLVPHNFQEATYENFWSNKIKSKSPYLWTNIKKENSFNRFGFVGYEIEFNGDLRVRKKSLEKEKLKQKKIVNEIVLAIRSGKRKKDTTIFESAVNRLIGMSVGRVNLTNYADVKNEMCWTNGFIKLNNNLHLRKQLRELDNFRSKQISTLLKFFNNNKTLPKLKNLITVKKDFFSVIDGVTEKDSIEIRLMLQKKGFLNSKFQFKKDVLKTGKNILKLEGNYHALENEIFLVIQSLKKEKKNIYYGKPFSYYYHIIEKKAT
jgi:hypothetical protein